MKFKLLCLIAPVLLLYSCEKCTIDPDLIPDLLAPGTNIILGEPVDWKYVIKSVKDNSDCKIIDAVASAGSIVVDYFVDQTATNSDTILNEIDQIGKLCAGKEETVTNTVSFDSSGVYLIYANADVQNNVTERNESNNLDNQEEIKTASAPLFKNASIEFQTKLEKCSALVIVGQKSGFPSQVKSYNGKPVYYAK
jgi:hypothetical protein